MAKEIVMPRLSDTMEEGKILRWHKKVGDPVQKGEPLVEVETDKANMELESYDNGFVTKILLDEGAQVPIGQPIAYIGTKEEADAVGSAQVAAPAAPPVQTPAAVEAVPAPQETIVPAGPAVAVASEDEDGRVKVSPLAKRIAAERGIDLRLVAGTGPGGRILRDDVENYRGPAQAVAPVSAPVAVSQPAPVAAPAQALTPVELNRMQQTIAKRMSESKQQVPHFYVTIEVDTAELTELRKRLNAAGDDIKISYTDLLVKAVALAIKEMPLLNASWKDNTLVMNEIVNVGLAVAVPRGLLVPVVHDVGGKTVRQIAADNKGLVQRTRDNTLRPEDMQGATITISNLGMYDVEEFAAIVNQPNAAILAVGAIKQKPVVVNGQLAVGERMRITISADHRAVYGAEAAEFLQILRRRLESPYGLVS